MTINGEWSPWASKVPKIEVETHKVGSPDIVVPTLDTVRHESLLNTWLADHKPLVRNDCVVYLMYDVRYKNKHTACTAVQQLLTINFC